MSILNNTNSVIINNENNTLFDFYFIRHGLTDWNIKKKLMGHIDIPLNHLGKQQAENACITISNIPFKTIFSSPLSRAKETTHLLLKDSNNYFLDYLDEFKEINFGDHQGEDITNLTIPEIVENKIDDLNGENLQEIYHRIEQGLRLLHSYPKPRLLVSHSGLYYILCQFLKIKYIDLPHCKLIHLASYRP